MRQFVVVALLFACAVPAVAQFADFNDRGVAFAHVHVVVADVGRHTSLWSELFDAAVVEKQGYSAVRIDGALVFFREGLPAAPSASTAIDHIGLEVRDLEQVLSKWRALGYDVDSAFIDDGGIPSAFVTMPGGVRLALHEDPEQTERTSMRYVHFSTTKRDELMMWYTARFGATQSTRVGSGNALAVPGAGLVFAQSETDRLPTDGTSIDHIGFEIEDWDAFIAALEDDGVEFEFGPVHVESLDIWVAFFNDPSGVLVEVSHGLDRY